MLGILGFGAFGTLTLGTFGDFGFGTFILFISLKYFQLVSLF
jgi:hypothetical protein